MLLNINGFKVELENISDQQYKAIITHFSDQLKRCKKKRDAIAGTFLYAIKLCPESNPSDVWHHIIYRHFIAQDLGINQAQSWVRSGGEALEFFFPMYYNPMFLSEGIRMRALISRVEKRKALESMHCVHEVGDAKLDIALEGIGPEGDVIFGGVHVKASLAERVSDDEPASRALMKKGFYSPLLTLDVKSFPPPQGDYVNRGELGSPSSPSEKRKYIEEHGSFDNCYSYNLRSVASKPKTKSGKYIYVQKLNGQPDFFVKDVSERWRLIKDRN